MHIIADDLGGANAWRVTEHAHIRATARRQLAFSIPIVIAGLFAAAVLTFSADPTTRTSLRQQHSPISAPAAPQRIVVG
jgi:hypothetical protein